MPEYDKQLSALSVTTTVNLMMHFNRCKKQTALAWAAVNYKSFSLFLWRRKVKDTKHMKALESDHFILPLFSQFFRGKYTPANPIILTAYR